MTKIKLSKRLFVIAAMVNKESIIADVGCDHALLDVYLTQNNIIKKAYACDVAKGALEQAKKNISLCNVSNVETRLGDGLSALSINDGVDTIIISGLGNQKINSILLNDSSFLNGISTLIIQANTGVSSIRKNVVKLGYYVEDEKLVEERGIIYTVIKFSKGTKRYSKRQITFGPVLLNNKNELFTKLLNENIDSYKRILNNLPNKKIIKRMIIKRKIKSLENEKTT